ncbi:ATP-binding cassette domain-containing protein, partial [Chryseobacterium mucoviscidosis]|uniref:ATP-binding cassette domain-containing protein n=1 Tax=Chryseobacterium mucoviscidosis TaxID=1945581 RepID=UPI001E5709E2
MTLTLHFGQKISLMGRSGSGKSLLLQALADLLPLDNANKIMLNKNGKLIPISQISATDYRSVVALFHQSPNLSDG